jgi:hypothetical protein
VSEVRTLPHSLDAEQSVLGSILRNDAMFSVVAAIIEPADFFRKVHRDIFECMCGLAARQSAVDLITVAESLRRNNLLEEVGGPAYIGGLVDGIPDSASVAHYAKIVKAKALNRRLIADANKMLDAAYGEILPAAEIAQGAIKDLAELQAKIATGLRTTRASDIQPEALEWLWTDRLSLGALALLGGREGIGKSLAAYSLVGDITRGSLPGAMYGRPRNVVIAATEDSWSSTIVPRLMAAGADRSRVYRVDDAADLVFPRDVEKVQASILRHEAILALLDPLMSRIDGRLNSHNDQQTRKALEPLAQVAQQTQTSILGIIHVNKGASTDPLNALMGSRAFTAVPRHVMFCAVDPEDEMRRVLGQAKNNDGPPALTLPLLAFRAESAVVGEDTKGQPIKTARLIWGGTSGLTLTDVMDASAGDRTQTREAADWLSDYLADGNPVKSVDVKRAGQTAGYSGDVLKRARKLVKATVTSVGFPRQTYWQIPAERPGGSPSAPALTTAPTAPTVINGHFSQSAQSVRLAQSVQLDEWESKKKTNPTEAVRLYDHAI